MDRAARARDRASVPTARPEIELSWRRSSMSGLAPDDDLHRIGVQDVDLGGRLADAARPVVDALLDDLDSAPVCVVVADGEARLTLISCGDTRLLDRLEEAGAVTGRRFSEETTGTNSIATAHEIRSGVAVRGDEHFAKSLRGFSCYGRPVIHPATRRLEGVASLVCLAEDDARLLDSLLRRVTREVEQGLLRRGRLRDQNMLAAFQAAAARRVSPVLVSGPDLVLASPAVSQWLAPADHARLRAMTGELPTRGARLGPVVLESGVALQVRASPVPGAPGGVVFELRPQEPPTGPVALGRAQAGVRTTQLPHRRRDGQGQGPVLVTGECGTGRSTRLRELADGGPTDILHAADARIHGEADWLAGLQRAATSRAGLLAVEDVQLLSPAMARCVSRVVESTRCRIALSGTPEVTALSPEHAGLCALCAEHVELRPLRERARELPDLIAVTLKEAGADPSVRFTHAALDFLTAYAWPGNLTELNAVVRQTLRDRPAGDITSADLPARCRENSGRRLSPLEHAERRAITEALTASGGNKTLAALALAISRTTLYSRMRALRIPG